MRVCVCVCAFWCNLCVLNGSVHFTHQRPHVHVLVHEVTLGHVPL